MNLGEYMRGQSHRLTLAEARAHPSKAARKAAAAGNCSGDYFDRDAEGRVVASACLLGGAPGVPYSVVLRTWEPSRQ